ncbi:unnamed protein product [Medioppia subpectinata]|uniref:Uncharacterized protein n=1 Tax=Medioppia subpectinata TaxID=1979941 RepID=A0A7R9KIZ9_9ACAR|nr:unnamed protein product [Medioppia subpectinata]CAG2104573.1 unnamed protein product [Medioppia subpectinata]
MCILFIKTVENANCGEYKLVLVNIRDEYYARPTKPVSFWDNRNTRIIGGQDMDKGREGGAWLAMNTNGKIASLLNILQPKDEISADKKGRGFLVVDYLEGNDSPKTYLDQISKDSSDYNGFRMIAIHLKSQSIEMSTYSNFDLKTMQLNPGVHAFGNNKMDQKLWPKVRIGKQKFEEIVDKHKNTTSKSQLIDDIFDFLSDKSIYPLDDQMRSQGRDKSKSLEKLNAIHVVIPENNYGSRTWTIILVDNNLNVDYIEKTMKEPIDASKDIEWITNSHTFKIT